MSGYTIIDVCSMNEALSIARDYPFIYIGGLLEVSEIIQILVKN